MAPKFRKLTTTTSATSTTSTATTILNDDLESTSSSSIRRKNRLNFNNMVMMMVDDSFQNKEKFCYDSVEEGSEASIMTTKTSSTNDTYDNNFSHIDVHKMDPRRHNVGSSQQSFKRQNAIQLSSATNIESSSPERSLFDNRRLSSGLKLAQSSTVVMAGYSPKNSIELRCSDSILGKRKISEDTCSDRVTTAFDAQQTHSPNINLRYGKHMKTNVAHRASFHGRG